MTLARSDFLRPPGGGVPPVFERFAAGEGVRDGRAWKIDGAGFSAFLLDVGDFAEIVVELTTLGDVCVFRDVEAGYFVVFRVPPAGSIWSDADGVRWYIEREYRYADIVWLNAVFGGDPKMVSLNDFYQTHDLVRYKATKR